MGEINVYKLVTERIIAELENGIIPWAKPWTGTSAGAYSRSTGRAYSLLNQMLLQKPGEYMTFRQVKEAGGHVKRGEKANIVVFWKPVKVTEQDAEGHSVEKLVPYLRYYSVFHIDQTEGVEPLIKAEHEAEFRPIEEAERISAAYLKREQIPLVHRLGDEASYSPARDSITLPLQEQFIDSREYYATLFHEAIHSTGHRSRLNRLTATVHFGSENYSKEELVAEIGSATLMNSIGIESPKTFRNSAAYIQGWLTALRNDQRLIVSAGSKAEKASGYILGTATDKEGSNLNV